MESLEQKYDGLVFDFDGTLADTMPTHFVAWTQVLNKHGITFPEDQFYSFGGMPVKEIIEILAEEQNVDVDVGAVAEEKEALFLEILEDVQPIEPVKKIAEDHRGRLPMAVATGSPAELADMILKKFGIRDWFDAIVGAGEVENPKPAPDTFALAARQLGVEPSRCFAFEDTQLGMQSAKNAGMEVININTLL